MSVLVWRQKLCAVLDYSGIVGVLDAWHACHTLHSPVSIFLLSSPPSLLSLPPLPSQPVLISFLLCWLTAGQSPGQGSQSQLSLLSLSLSLSRQPHTLNCHNLCPLIICQILLKFFILSPAFHICFTAENYFIWSIWFDHFLPLEVESCLLIYLKSNFCQADRDWPRRESK